MACQAQTLSCRGEHPVHSVTLTPIKIAQILTITPVRIWAACGWGPGISCVCRTNQVEGMLLKLPMGFPIRMVCQHPKTLHAHVLGHDNPCLRKDVHPMISLWMHFDLAGYLPPWGISQCMGFGPCFSSCWIAGDIKTISKTAASATLAHGEKPFTCLTASDRTGYVLVLFRALIEIMSSVFFPFFDM